jgi:hypothetical protein
LAITHSSISYNFEEKKQHLSDKKEERLSKGTIRIKSFEEISDYLKDGFSKS